MHFNHVEFVKIAFDRCLAAAMSDQCVVDAPMRNGVEDQAAPLSRSRLRGRPVARRIKSPARSKSIVLDRCENDRVLLRAFGNQVRLTT